MYFPKRENPIVATRRSGHGSLLGISGKVFGLYREQQTRLNKGAVSQVGDNRVCRSRPGKWRVCCAELE